MAVEPLPPNLAFPVMPGPGAGVVNPQTPDALATSPTVSSYQPTSVEGAYIPSSPLATWDSAPWDSALSFAEQLDLTEDQRQILPSIRPWLDEIHDGLAVAPHAKFAQDYLRILLYHVTDERDLPVAPYAWRMVGQYIRAMRDEVQAIEAAAPYKEKIEKDPDAALPPHEVVRAWHALGYDAKDVFGMPWRAVPQISPLQRMSVRALRRSGGSDDAYAALEKYLDDPQFAQTLRIMDVANGCGVHCGTCCADAPLPTRMFSYESLERLFSDERFIKMLQPHSFRVGSAGDISDHPRAADIVEMMVQKTHSLHQEQEKKGKTHTIKIFTNYRRQREQTLLELLALARKYPDRIELVISLPITHTDEPNKDFGSFMRNLPEYFNDPQIDAKGRVEAYRTSASHHTNITTNDVRHFGVHFMVGRVMKDEMTNNENRADDFKYRGGMVLFFNPDGLWLKVYATQYESHTGRAFLPAAIATPQMLRALPWHSDFPSPPAWSPLQINYADNSMLAVRKSFGSHVRPKVQ